MRPIQVIAHRGASAHEPENTLRAIRRALDDCADMIEIDVRLVDGEIIVFHDDIFDRCTSGSGPLYTRSFSDLRNLDAGKGEKIPTLAEVLALIDERIPLNIEFKDAESVRPTCALIESLSPELTILSSFDWENLRQSRRLLPNVRIGVLTDHATDASLQEAKALNAVSVNLHIESLTAEFVKNAHTMGLSVYTFTARTESDLTKIRSTNADGCFADDPAWAKRLWLY
jgi:glycerophosphoryl diester phosphodiesterase